MFRSLMFLRFVSRLGLLAVVGAVLFPAIGHALENVASQDVRRMQVCTASGIQYRTVEEDTVPDRVARYAKHCAYCLVSTVDDALPGPDMRFALSSVFVFLPVLYVPHDLPVAPGAYVHARAPPATV